MVFIEQVSFPRQKNILFLMDWKKLREQCNSQFAFSAPDWLAAWWDVYGERYEPLTFAVYEDDRLVAVFPFMLTQGRGLLNCCTMGAPEATHVEFAVLPEYVEESVQLLMEALENVRGSILFDFFGMNGQSAVYAAMLRHLDSMHRRYLTVAIPSPVIRIEGKDYKTYFNNRFSTHNRHNMKRNEKRLEMLGSVSVRPLEPRDMPAAFAIHTLRWQEKLDTSGFESEESSRFFTGLLTSGSDDWQALAMGLFLGERLVAFQYGFLCNDRALFYRSAHDNLLSIYAPGKQIKRSYIRFCFEKGLATIDLGIGYEEYKEEWTEKQDIVYNLYFSKGNVFSRLPFFYTRLKYSLKAKLKESRRVVLFKRNTLGKLKYIFSPQALRAFLKRTSASIQRQGLLYYLFGKMKLLRSIVLQYSPESGAEIAAPSSSDAIVEKAGAGEMEELALLLARPVREVVRHFYRQNDCLFVKRGNGIACAALITNAPDGVSIVCHSHKKLCREQDADALMAGICKYIEEHPAPSATVSLLKSEHGCLCAAKRAGFQEISHFQKEIHMEEKK